MQLVFWHNFISPHQAPYMRALAESGHDVLVVATEAMSEDRLKLGCTLPDLGPARAIVSPDHAQVVEIINQSADDSIHFIAGARGTRLGKQVAVACRAAHRRMGIVTESPDVRGFSGFLRRCKYSIERVGIGRFFDFVLAMGTTGVRWFLQCGYPAQRVFSFAYVTEKPQMLLAVAVEPSARFVFVGRLVELKGVDLLLQAIAQTAGVRLEVIGDGPLLSELISLAEALVISDRVRWLGQMGQAGIQQHLNGADALVLPSRKDGWGAVVNEALMVGTPVICSTACGATELLRSPILGTVFRSGSVDELASALKDFAGHGRRTAADRERIRGWSRCIEGHAIAGYVESILSHVYSGAPRPEAPWRSIIP